VPLAEYYFANSNSTQVHQILALVRQLSEHQVYNYSLACPGGFVRSSLVYFEKCIVQKVLKAANVSKPKTDQSGNPTSEEQFYQFSDKMEADLLATHAKIFANFMVNPNVAKFVARNLLNELRFAFIVLSAAMRGKQGVDESIGRDLMQGLGFMLKQKEPIQVINKNTYIADWFFYRLFEVALVY
jgi:hypothetical protein